MNRLVTMSVVDSADSGVMINRVVSEELERQKRIQRRQLQALHADNEGRVAALEGQNEYMRERCNRLMEDRLRQLRAPEARMGLVRRIGRRIRASFEMVMAIGVMLGLWYYDDGR